jgi:hypothetical protein
MNKKGVSTIVSEVKLNELEERVFVLELKEVNFEDIEKISIAPLLKGKSGEFIKGNVEDSIEI